MRTTSIFLLLHISMSPLMATQEQSWKSWIRNTYQDSTKQIQRQIEKQNSGILGFYKKSATSLLVNHILITILDATYKNDPQSTETIQNEISDMGMDMYHIPASSSPQALIPAYATPNHIFISSKWVDQLSPKALQGVIAHEGTHLIEQHGWRNLLTTFIIVPAVAYATYKVTPYLLPRWGYAGAIRHALKDDTSRDQPDNNPCVRFTPKTEDKIRSTCEFWIPFIIANMLDAYFSKYCEYRADIGAATHAGGQAGQAITESLPFQPVTLLPFMSHPPRYDRIAAVQEYIDGTDNEIWSIISRPYRIIGNVLYRITDYFVSELPQKTK